jgi:hypothetical protein
MKMANRRETEVRESIHFKLDTNYYNGTLPYPKKADFKVEEQVVTRKLGIHTISGCDEQAYRAAMDAYRAEQIRLNEEFKADALHDVGLTGHPKADKAYALAWEHGHSGGLSEVLVYLVDFAELVK